MSTELYDVANCERVININGQNIFVTWWGGMLVDKEELLMDYAKNEIEESLKKGERFGDLLYEDDRNKSLYGMWIIRL